MTPSNTATVRGTVHAIGETQIFGAKGFRKRMLVLNATPHGMRYPEHIVASLVRDGVDWADTISVGDPVELKVRITGRYHELTSRWFADVEVVEGYTIGGDVPVPVRYEPPPPPRPAPLPPVANPGPGVRGGPPLAACVEDDDVPF